MGMKGYLYDPPQLAYQRQLRSRPHRRPLPPNRWRLHRHRFHAAYRPRLSAHGPKRLLEYFRRRLPNENRRPTASPGWLRHASRGASLYLPIRVLGGYGFER